MAYGVKYRVEHTDNNGLTWKVDFLFPDYEGSVTDLKHTGDPLKFHYDNESDDIFSPIKPTIAEVNVYALAQFSLADMYSYNYKHIQVEIYQDDTNLFFKGFVNSSAHKEPYADTPYPVTIHCTDGLDLLKDLIYDTSDLISTDLVSVRSHIDRILMQLGYDEKWFFEYINLYDAEFDDGYADSAIGQAYMQWLLYEDRNCAEALEKLLRSFNAVIRQKDGYFRIYRPKALTAQVYGRRPTYTDWEATNYNPEQFINRISSASSFKEAGGTLMMLPPAKKVIIKQDYGIRDSWILNHKFTVDTYDGETFRHWSKYKAAVIQPLKIFVPTENEGMVLTSKDTYPTHAKGIKQDFGRYAVQDTTGIYELSFDYLFINQTAGDKSVTFYLRIEDSNTTKQLKNYDSNYLQWDTAPQYVSVSETVTPGVSEWKSYKRLIIGVDASVLQFLKIVIWSLDSSYGNVYHAIKNVRFNATSNEIGTKLVKPGIPLIHVMEFNDQKVVTVYKKVNVIDEYIPVMENVIEKENDTEGVTIEQNVILGDVLDTGLTNVIPQFNGALFKYKSGSPPTVPKTSSWHTQHASPEENIPLMNLIINEIAEQYAVPRQMLQVHLQETSQAPAINIIGNFQDNLNKKGLVNRIFVMNRATFNVKPREWDMDLVEISPFEEVVPIYSVTPSTINVDNQEQYKVIEILSNVPWEITSCPAWITPSATSGLGNMNISLLIAENTGETERSDDVEVTFDGVATPETVTVTQAAEEESEQIFYPDVYSLDFLYNEYGSGNSKDVNLTITPDDTFSQETEWDENGEWGTVTLDQVNNKMSFYPNTENTGTYKYATVILTCNGVVIYISIRHQSSA